MRVLLIGSGGREHALAWKLKQSPRLGRLYCAPGNGGIAQLAELVPIKATAISELVGFAVKEKIDLCVVAPDDPLALGLVDELTRAGIRAFGPTKAAARIESSKVFAKQLMQKQRIPTASCQIFTDSQAAQAYAAQAPLPLVIKADGLALGKGVVIAQNRAEAAQAITEMMQDGIFGQAGRTILIEECLTGPEMTLLAFTDGKTIVPLVSSRDHKRAYDQDRGPNTGGMGALAPAADLTSQQWQEINEKIMQPTIAALNEAGSPFQGVLYFGLMLTEKGPQVIEYNARFGDPEAQVVLPLLETDLLDIIEAILEKRLDQIKLVWRSGAACCLVLASGGYPGDYKTGYPIMGLDKVPPDCLVFHAGSRQENGQFFTAGGRVLGLTALGRTSAEAVSRAYAAIQALHFTDMHYRRDIGKTR